MVGSCVALKNHRFFVGMLFAGQAGCILMAAGASWRLHSRNFPRRAPVLLRMVPCLRAACLRACLEVLRICELFVHMHGLQSLCPAVACRGKALLPE